MCARRGEHQLVVLADGSVLSLGGSLVEARANDEYFKGVYDTELWRNGYGWSKLAPMTHRSPLTPRMYHSTALLVPDGRVLVAGGECKDDFNRCPGFSDKFCANGDFYSPPYLFKARNTPIVQTDRPAIIGISPLSVAYGEGLSFHRSVGFGASWIAKVALAKPGATTRSDDMEQHYIPLTFTDGSPLTVAPAQMPTANQAPPGFYMLFMVNNFGKPSTAPFVALWEVNKSSVSHSLSYDVGTFAVTVTWKTTAKAVDGDALVLTPSGGSTITITGTPTDPAGIQHALSYSGTCVPNQLWSYYVRSKRPRYTPGDALSVSTSSTKSFRTAFCLE